MKDRGEVRPGKWGEQETGKMEEEGREGRELRMQRKEGEGRTAKEGKGEEGGRNLSERLSRSFTLVFKVQVGFTSMSQE